MTLKRTISSTYHIIKMFYKAVEFKTMTMRGEMRFPLPIR